MGWTPNIDRIAREGMLFTDHYGQPSCTAGRAAFIMGQLPVRTGMTTIGIPGSTRGIQKYDPDAGRGAEDSRATRPAQFGKNHLGDRNEFLPTVHGFDEWFGNLYHLNAEEEPEELDYPGPEEPRVQEEVRSARRAARLGHRQGRSHRPIPKFGRVGKQKIEDTGPLTRKRMETFDGEVLDETLNWLDRTAKSDKPFFLLVQHHRHPHLVAPPEEIRADGGGRGPRGRGRRAREDDRARRAGRRAAQEARGPRHRRQHHRHLHHRQRQRADDLARRRLRPVPRREGHDLGRRRAGSVLVRWPGKMQPRAASPTGSRATRICSSRSPRRPGLPNLQGEAARRTEDRATLTYKVHLDGYNNLDHWTGQSREVGPPRVSSTTTRPT